MALSISLLVSTAAAFLFDLDGTLADTLPDLAASTNFVRAQHGLPAVDHTAVRTFIGDGARKLLERALRELVADDRPLPAELLDHAFALYIEHHASQCTVHSRLFDGAHDYLTELRRRGHGIAIVTNKPERFAVPVARFLGLDAFTDVIIGGDTLPTKKPDPAMLELALHRLGNAAHTATMIGDGLQDVRAGKAAGCRTIACLYGYGDADRLRVEHADECWHEFGQPHDTDR